ncbi:hypothetical protein M513_14252 [Trichuris suis]|uniref:Uncharacterized protein n=1 Tax=Trichuris suis TaxID=68888 RepID=A0A085LIS6_9BILA|nr:hypothetical protein M513_14252 [Trichuris suis]
MLYAYNVILYKKLLPHLHMNNTMEKYGTYFTLEVVVTCNVLLSR